MDLTDKIDRYLGEATVPSQGWIRSEMSKGLSKNVNDVAWKVGMNLWHYFDLKIIKGPGLIFKSQSSNKLSDELWYRIGKPVEDSEYLDDSGIKKLKNNFYRIMSKWSKIYSWDNDKKGWKFTG